MIFSDQKQNLYYFLSVMATAGSETLDRAAKDDEKKKRPEVGDQLK